MDERDEGAAGPSTQELLNSDFARRKLEREYGVCETARKVLSLCRYKRAEIHGEYVAPSARHAAFGFRLGNRSYIQLWLASPMRWLDEVYKAGISTASGCFVFEAARRLPDGALVVIAGRQGRGCGVHAAYALARPGRGSWSLEWKGLPEEFRVQLPRMSGRVAQMKEVEGEYYDEASMRRAGELLSAKLYPKPEGGG